MARSARGGLDGRRLFFGVLFEETQRTLLCSDLFHRTGDVEPVTESDVVGRSYQAMREYQAGVLAEYVPYTPLTSQNLQKLAALEPRTLAIMHGSSFRGNWARAAASRRGADHRERRARRRLCL